MELPRHRSYSSALNETTLWGSNPSSIQPWAKGQPPGMVTHETHRKSFRYIMPASHSLSKPCSVLLCSSLTIMKGVEKRSRASPIGKVKARHENSETLPHQSTTKRTPLTGRARGERVTPPGCSALKEARDRNSENEKQSLALPCIARTGIGQLSDCFPQSLTWLGSVHIRFPHHAHTFVLRNGHCVAAFETWWIITAFLASPRDTVAR